MSAALHVHLSRTEGDKKYFVCSHLHRYHTFQCQFSPGEVVLCNIDKESHSFRNVMLVVSPFDDTLLEGYSTQANIPSFLLQFGDTETLSAFVELACVTACTTGYRSKRKANQADEVAASVVVMMPTIALPPPVAEKDIDVAALYPVEGLTKIGH